MPYDDGVIAGTRSGRSVGQRLAEQGIGALFPAHPRGADPNWWSLPLPVVVKMLGADVSTEPGLMDITFPVWRLRRGDALFRMGDPFCALYVIRSGFFKTVSVDAAGAEFVLGFPMAGEALGLDGVDSGQYETDVVALDMGTAVVLPFAALAHLAHEHPMIAGLLYSIFSRDVVRSHGAVRMLATLRAEARLATFLLDQSDRLGRRGYSPTLFELRMSRKDIAGYLGVSLETVSRTLTALAADGLITVDLKVVVLRNIAGLRRVVSAGIQKAPHRPVTAIPLPISAMAARQPRANAWLQAIAQRSP